MKTLLRLYPAAWRRRYGSEVGALLEGRPRGWSDTPDLLMGAIDAHMHPVALGLTAHDEGRMAVSTLRLGGWAAVLGGGLWFLAYVGFGLVGLIARTQPRGVPSGEGAAFLVGLVVTPVCLVAALVGISRSLTGQRRTLALLSSLLPATAAGVMTVGLVANAVLPDRPFVSDADTWEGWTVAMVGLVLGCLVFGCVIGTSGWLSRWAAALLLVGVGRQRRHLPYRSGWDHHGDALHRGRRERRGVRDRLDGGRTRRAPPTPRVGRERPRHPRPHRPRDSRKRAHWPGIPYRRSTGRHSPHPVLPGVLSTIPSETITDSGHVSAAANADERAMGAPGVRLALASRPLPGYESAPA